jgi:hypothetical protein
MFCGSGHAAGGVDRNSLDQGRYYLRSLFSAKAIHVLTF